MTAFHAIGGLPRSGSTLLCNILNQNPRFYASSTSCVAPAMRQAASFLSSTDEIRSELVADRARTERRFVALLRGMMEGWYSDVEQPVVFDKSRAWNHNALLLRQLYPDAKLILVVRDLREVFASIEKQHRKNVAMTMPGGSSVAAKADAMFARPGGMIGGPVAGVEDILRRCPDNVALIKYEQLCADPSGVLRTLYEALGEPWFEHDLDNVHKHATELDALWLHKFPHEGSGAVERADTTWPQYVAPDLARRIMGQFPLYNNAFGYR